MVLVAGVADTGHEPGNEGASFRVHGRGGSISSTPGASPSEQIKLSLRTSWSEIPGGRRTTIYLAFEGLAFDFLAGFEAVLGGELGVDGVELWGDLGVKIVNPSL